MTFQTMDSHSIHFLTKGFCGCKNFNTVQRGGLDLKERFCGLASIQIIVGSVGLAESDWRWKTVKEKYHISIFSLP